MKINSLDDFLSLLDGVKPLKGNEYKALCPAHDDKNPSLSVTEKDEKILVNCFAGCSTREILRALKLQDKDLFLDSKETPTRPDIVETYDYTDENGQLLFQVCRTEDKSFPQRRPTDDGWEWGLGEVDPVLYNLPEVKEAIQNNRYVLLTEGEKDADNLNKLDLVATCNPMGAGNWKEKYNEVLRDAWVVVIPDNDKPGVNHAYQVANSLLDTAKTVKKIEFPEFEEVKEKHGEDVTDWFENGGSKKKLKDLVENAPEWEAEPPPYSGNGQMELSREKNNEGSEWDRVSEIYREGDKKDARFAAAQALLNEREFVALSEGDKLLTYKEDEGTFNDYGREYIETRVQSKLSKELTAHDVNEIIGHVKRSSYRRQRDFGPEDPGLICVKNGVLDVETGELFDHSPDFEFQRSLPVKYDPEATSEELDAFLNSTLREKDIPLIEEVAGFCLYREYFLRKAVMFIGEGGNGKTITLQLIENLLGSENVAGWTLQELETNQYAKANLYKKFANIAGDLPGKRLKDTGIFKQLTGRDHITGDIKYAKRPIEFVNYAKLLFSTNNVPATPDDTEAFFDRWVLIEFPYKFVEDPAGENEKKKDPNILEKITTERAKSAFLNRALEGLRRLSESGEFSFDKNTSQVRKQYERLSQPIKAFVDDYLIQDDDNFIPKDEVYNAYREYCEENELPVKDKAVFSRRLGKHIKVSSNQHRIDGERKRCYEKIDLDRAPF